MVMKSLFEDILLYSMEYDDLYDNSFKEPRWIYGDSNDTDWLKHTVLKHGPVIYTSNKIAAILEYNGLEFFIITSIRRFEDTPYFLFEIEPNPGLSTVIIYELKIPIKNNLPNGHIFNLMASQHKSIKDYRGHEIDDIKSIFDDFYCFQIDPNQRITHQQIFRFTGSFLSKNPVNLTLNLEPDTSVEFDNAFLYGPDNLPYENLLTSILSTTYKHAFIELYQCLENLYQVFYIADLFDVLTPSMNFIKFLKEIEQSLSWRPNESNTIEKIFSQTPAHIYSGLTKLKISKNQGMGNESHWLYNIRNQLVHLRVFQERIDFTQKEWNILMRETLKMIIYWYTVFDKKLRC